MDKLPPGAGEGTCLIVAFQGDKLVTVEINAEETARIKARITAKMERLRQRGRKTSR